MRQQVLPFLRRSWRRERVFKAAIAAATILTVIALVATSPTGRYGVLVAANRVRWGVQSLVGLRPSRAEIEAERQQQRSIGVRRTRAMLAESAVESGPAVEQLLKVVRMDPDTAVIRWGNFDGTLVLSSEVFEPDDTGRSYRFKPGVRSIWVIGLALRKALCQFQVPDTPKARDACAAATGRVIPQSVQTTNSWGCRGPEPDTTAPLRGIVLGDSVMQGVLVGDAETPPACLERELARRTGRKVSVLNAAVLGYSPEQYWYTLQSFVDRMSPHFIIVSLCGNDFGDWSVPGNWDESCYWLERISDFCRTREIHCLIVPWPGEDALVGWRDESVYPGQVSRRLRLGGTRYFYPLEAFTDEDLRLRHEARQTGKRDDISRLYNRHLLGDNHLSPLGCAFWGRVVAERLYRIMVRREFLSVNPPASSPSEK
jgi:hypothetical protein